MDFLKRHYEKILLAVALLALIASAVYLALSVSQVSNESPMARSGPRVGTNPHINLTTYSNAIALLAEPASWTNGNPFLGPDMQITQPPPTNTGTGTSVESPIVLLSLVRKPFKLLFKTYSFDPSRGGYNFQINFQFRARTFFISSVGDVVKDHFEDTGYKIVNFEKKSAMVDDPTINGKREKDVSELTVQHEGNPPVVLVLNKESEDQEPVAQVRCTADGLTGEYRRGQTFKCGTNTYKVIDIDMNLKQMLILDTQTQKEQPPIKSRQ
ncbi:MAG TPA: hypothetical protein VMV72_19560 [Verrucomicrobiae bacterium]|nr:hypothetical protein [Verrucomicrobiae bacterium]